MADRLSAVEVQTHLSQLPHWTLQGNAIQQVKTFPGFPEAVAFVERLVAPAEAAGHHPDLAISYNRVTITLTTHDAGGLTALDFALARQIDQL